MLKSLLLDVSETSQKSVILGHHGRNSRRFAGLFPRSSPQRSDGTRHAIIEAMKNFSFIAGPKNGAFVTTRMSAMHHSAESRLGMGEVIFAGIVVLALVGFTLVLVN